MAHDLVVKNGRAAMAYVGKTPWHGLGQQVTQGAPLEVWAQQAGMNWEIKSLPITYEFRKGEWATVPDKVIAYRSDTGAPLSVVGKSFQFVQPTQVLELFREWTEAGNFHIHTAGVMDSGRKFWVLAKNGMQADVIKGDSVRGNILAATSCDGTMRTRVLMTNIRVVCANTLAQALTNGRGQGLSISHRSKFDPATVRTQLEQTYGLFDKFMMGARQMAASKITPAEAKALLVELLGKPAKVQTEAAKFEGAVAGAQEGGELSILLARPMKINNDETAKTDSMATNRIFALYDGKGIASTVEGVAGTRWGLFNAITEYYDHHQGRTQDARLQSAWFGDSAEIKQQAFDLLTK